MWLPLSVVSSPALPGPDWFSVVLLYPSVHYSKFALTPALPLRLPYLHVPRLVLGGDTRDFLTDCVAGASTALLWLARC